MIPSFFIIGDSLSFTADDVKSGRTDANLPSATATYSFIDAQTRIEIASGSMSQYDTDPSSFEAVIASTLLEEFDAQSNPDGIKVKQNYILRVTTDNAGLLTTHSAEMVALYEPPTTEE